ncbi:hypothetical protein FB45DRAFT_794332 [Roridomyces roridus]|uniref:DUF1212-domain-containing protein n=1 Tax=Roridomyces roridus TaxID=1738132 RepID=A0AAD7BR87_9AGAR|nr:hypothetical protein FB45DRAFT_794332 [Roridomyces roridus]
MSDDPLDSQSHHPGIISGRDSPRAAPGTKTPRKVQWLDTHDETTEPEESSIHALDEHGNDPNAFETLTTALERHQATTPVARVHYFAPRPGPIDTDVPLESGPTTFSSEGEDSRPPSPPHEPVIVPGNYIEPGENAGLPGPSDVDQSAHRAASKVVRAHTRKGGMFRMPFPKRARKSKDKQRVDTEKTHDPEDHSRPSSGDAEAYLGGSGPLNPALGGGVLSALLTLYNEQGPGTRSGASTPGIEEPPELPWVTPPPSARRPYPVPRTPAPVDHHQSPLTHANIPSPPSPSPGSPESHLHDSSRSSPDYVTPPRKTKARLSLGLGTKSRSGGALGALIASTGNISGAAAPVNSTLAPNIKRPGYHLSRYSVDEGEPVAPKVRERPRSLSGLPPPPPTPGTPGSMLEATGFPWSGSVVSLASKRGWTEKLRDLESFALSGTAHERQRSGRSTPASSITDRDEWFEDKLAHQAGEKRDKRRKRKKAEVYITRHVAQIIQRQEFILKLARALMMFGGPSHRLQAQIQATGRVLDIQANCLYLPDVVLISFDDGSTGTSNLKFIRQSSSLNLGKLNETYALYWKVIHDELAVSEASTELDGLMRRKQEYTAWQLVLIGGMCSAAICTVSFSGSFIDALVSFPLGALLVAIQLLSVRNELYSNVFEITVATLFSFVSAALASTGKLCYSAVASSAVVLILPGFIVLCGALEIMSRNIVAGSVRMCYAVVYSLFLGFGLAIGAEAYVRMTSKDILGSTDYTCSISHNPQGGWWQRTPSIWWAFLTVPMYSLFLSMRNFAPWRSKEMLLLIVFSCIGWVTNHFTSTKFVNRSDISAAVGAFAVSFLANVYARFFSGNAFVIMITGILFQLPSGLGNGGLLTYAKQATDGSTDSYLSGFQTALQLISVAIGLSIGLGVALAVVHPIQSRRRAGGVFSL